MRGHFLLSEFQLVATKGSKNAAGVPPDPRGSCRFSLQENLPGGIIKTNDKKRGFGPGLWAATCFQSRAQPNPGGPGPPCCMNVGSADAVPADFHKKKIGQQSGGPGAKPPASLCVLSPRGERTWPRIGYPFSLGQRFICADKLQHALQKRVWPAGHPLSLHKERGKRSARGSPPGPPRYFDF